MCSLNLQSSNKDKHVDDRPTVHFTTKFPFLKVHKWTIWGWGGGGKKIVAYFQYYSYVDQGVKKAWKYAYLKYGYG